MSVDEETLPSGEPVYEAHIRSDTAAGALDEHGPGVVLLRVAGADPPCPGRSCGVAHRRAPRGAGFTVKPAVTKPPEHPAPGMAPPPLDDPDPLDDPELLLDGPDPPPGPDGLLVCPSHPGTAKLRLRRVRLLSISAPRCLDGFFPRTREKFHPRPGRWRFGQPTSRGDAAGQFGMPVAAGGSPTVALGT